MLYQHSNTTVNARIGFLKCLIYLKLWHYCFGFHHQHKIRLASVRFCMSCVKKIITPEIISNNSKILFLVNCKSHILHLHIFVYFYGQVRQGETPHAIRYTMCFIVNNTGSQKVIGTAQPRWDWNLWKTVQRDVSVAVGAAAILPCRWRLCAGTYSRPQQLEARTPAVADARHSAQQITGRSETDVRCHGDRRARCGGLQYQLCL